ncbi:dipeptide epimerase [Zhouia amylolytica]|uniref:dipeptide epimerase n=1 Tax=Zhouia amylolytica TaxID=376730 RepID=UPI0020CCB2DC|nr:dipeptide epimerase [Zhouia amylolytica]MCQ0110008.1 dipeptide epimerase [Zhouia amylolytica]
MEIVLKKYVLGLKNTFGISRQSRDYQESLIVCLSLNGKTGYGEAAANSYYHITVDEMIEECGSLKNDLENYNFSTPSDLHNWLSSKNLSNFLRCAIDLAAYDLYGKLQQKPLYKIWNTSIDNYPITNYTIGIAPIEEMIDKMLSFPWPLYKIKLGTSNDLEIVETLRKYTKSTFRVDANCAWDAEETIYNSKSLKKLGVEFIEQPLEASNWTGNKKVFKESALPIIADESCITENDVEKCYGHFDGINIKLTKCGGLTPALRMIKRAQKLKLKTMVGCMTESTVGISAIAQLLPQLDYVDMDGAMLLKNDIAKGVQIKDNGKVIFPSLGGSGISLL